MANFLPPNSTVIKPVSQTTSPLQIVGKIREAKSESPKVIVVIFASKAINGGTSLYPQSRWSAKSRCKSSSRWKPKFEIANRYKPILINTKISIKLEYVDLRSLYGIFTWVG